MADDKLEIVGGRKVVMAGSLRQIAKSGRSRPVLVLDRSGSMSDTINKNQDAHQEESSETGHFERKIDALRRIVFKLRKEADFEQLVFDDQSEWTEEIPEPRGGTGLAAALDAVMERHPGTRRIVLITDGWPDSRDQALKSAKRLTCPLDIFYVGPLNDLTAQAFLLELAKVAGGQFGAADLGKDQDALENKVRLALNAGDPEEIKRGPIVL